MYFQRNWKFTHINEQECKGKCFLVPIFLKCVSLLHASHTCVCAHANIKNESNELSHNVNYMVMFTVLGESSYSGLLDKPCINKL